MSEKLTAQFEYTHHFNQEMIKLISENFEKINERTICVINYIFYNR